MATFLDIGLLKIFSGIFPFLLIFLLVYAVLDRVGGKFFKNPGVNALIALILAVMGSFSPIVYEAVNRMAPWFVLLIVAMVLGLLIIQMLGASEAKIFETIASKEYNYIIVVFVAIILVIVIGSITSVISERGGFPGPGETAPGQLEGARTQQAEFWETLFNPKILGFGAIMLIAAFTISKLCYKN